MRLRNLGRTGLRVSEMGLGTWGLSGDAYGPVDDAERELVLRRALEMGLTLLDTADVYGAGRMERLIGRVLGEGLDAVVVTKGGTDRTTSPARKCFDPPYLRASVERSLKRLQREAIDVYLLHCPDVESVTRSETVGLLKELRQEGKIRSWGVSAGDTAVGRAALRSGAEVIEIAYNLVNPSELHRLAGDVMVTGAGVLARSTLAYGLLCGTWSKGREFAAGDHRANRWTREELAGRIDQLNALRFLVNRNVPTLTSAAVRFVLANSIVSSAVLGPRSVEQLENIVRDVGMGPVYLRDWELSQLPRSLEAVGIES